MAPPPFRAAAQNATCGNFDEVLFREFLLDHTDGLFPQLWRSLLFQHGLQPDWEPWIYSMVVLPAHLFQVITSVALTCFELEPDPGFVLNLSVWIFSYHGIGLTDIWIAFSKIALRFLWWTWGHDGSMTVALSMLPAVGTYDAMIVCA